MISFNWIQLVCVWLVGLGLKLAKRSHPKENTGVFFRLGYRRLKLAIH